MPKANQKNSMKSYTIHLLKERVHEHNHGLPASLGKQIFATGPDLALREFFRQAVWCEQQIQCWGLVRESRLAGARFPFQVIKESERETFKESDLKLETVDRSGGKVVIRYNFLPFGKLHDYDNEFTRHEKITFFA